MRAYVIVYCGYEGIESVVAVEGDAEVAAVRVQRLREEMARKREACEEDWERDEHDPKRLCVMTEGKDRYECCCQALGVSTGETWWM